MTNTHKKVLGFAGLGLVVAMTTFAATIDVPGASALDAVSDNLKVRVLAGEPDVTIAEISGSVVTDPNYSITVDYENLETLKAVLVNRNADGNIIWEGTLFDEPTGSYAPGERIINLNLEDYNGKGDYTVTVTGTGEGGVPVEEIVSFTYTNTGPSVEPEDDKPTVDPQVPESVTKTLEVDIYDDLTGTLVRHDVVVDPSNPYNVDFSTVGDGLFRVNLSGKDKNGNSTLEKSELVLSGSEGRLMIEDQPEPFQYIVVTVRDANGNVVSQETIDPAYPGGATTFDMSGQPAGMYNVTMEYFNSNDQKVGGVSKDFRKLDGSQLPVDVPPIDAVTTVEAYIHDTDGNLVRIVRANRATGLVTVYDANGAELFTLDNGYTDQSFTIPMEGLPYGTYTGVMMYRNAAGKLVGDTVPFQIIYNDHGTPVVPDTGNFFQGFNLTREDYLISGLAIFVAVSALAFWLVKRSKSNRR